MILVIGKGHLGNIISKHINANLCDKRLEDVLAESNLKNITCIINAAGKTDLTWCENNKEEANYINSYLPIQLSKKAKKLGINFIQLSSGCVWNGPYDKNGNPFIPISKTSPACYYTQTKVNCDESLIKEMFFDNKIAILRLRMPYSEIHSPRNLFTKLMNYKNLINTHNSITSVNILCKTIKQLTNNSSHNLWNRITCVYDKGIITPYDIGVSLSKAGLRKLPGILSKYELDSFHKPQRVDTVMYDQLFEETIKPRNVNKEIYKALTRYKEKIK